VKTLNESLPSAFGVTALEALAVVDVLGLAVLFVTGEGAPAAVTRGVVVLTGAVLALAGLHVASRSLDPLDTARDVWASDPVPAAEAADADGPVAVQGTVEPRDETLESAYTGSRCVAYSCRRVRRRKHPVTSWRILEEDHDGVAFDVDDESGRVAVDPADATLSLESGDVGSYLARQVTGSGRIESRLDPRETVHVRGHTRKESETVTFAADGAAPLLIADTTDTGVVWRHLKSGAGHLVVGLPIALAGVALLGYAVVLYG